jgi:hypothetical protein
VVGKGIAKNGDRGPAITERIQGRGHRTDGGVSPAVVALHRRQDGPGLRRLAAPGEGVCEQRLCLRGLGRREFGDAPLQNADRFFAPAHVDQGVGLGHPPERKRRVPRDHHRGNRIRGGITPGGQVRLRLPGLDNRRRRFEFTRPGAAPVGRGEVAEVHGQQPVPSPGGRNRRVEGERAPKERVRGVGVPPRQLDIRHGGVGLRNGRIDLDRSLGGGHRHGPG